MKSIVSFALRGIVILSVIVGHTNGQVKPSAFGKVKPVGGETVPDPTNERRFLFIFFFLIMFIYSCSIFNTFVAFQTN